jgi:hypothetical protein
VVERLSEPAQGLRAQTGLSVPLTAGSSTSADLNRAVGTGAEVERESQAKTHEGPKAEANERREMVRRARPAEHGTLHGERTLPAEDPTTQNLRPIAATKVHRRSPTKSLDTVLAWIASAALYARATKGTVDEARCIQQTGRRRWPGRPSRGPSPLSLLPPAQSVICEGCLSASDFLRKLLDTPCRANFRSSH